MAIRFKSRMTYLVLAVPAAALLSIPGASVYYRSTQGAGCARCHEIRDGYEAWRSSTHRSVACEGCHGAQHALDANYHLGNLRRLVKHFRGQVPAQVTLRTADVSNIMNRCRNCHQQEFADWAAGPHGASYTKIFTDAKHNRKTPLRDDCMRCHGMHFEGSIQDLVTPVASAGAWKIADERLAAQPAIPCLACHEMHRHGKPLARGDPAAPARASKEEIFRPSLALFDRRSRAHASAAALPLPAMMEADRPVKMSTDPRQSLCYQCHAPLAGFQAGSGDDRTPLGVHEGLSCLACHQKHGSKTRASCAGCHPRLSNCGLDVEKMDTTFASPGSRHNIHTVTCAGCHPKGIPRSKRVESARRGVSGQ